MAPEERFRISSVRIDRPQEPRLPPPPQPVVVLLLLREISGLPGREQQPAQPLQMTSQLLPRLRAPPRLLPLLARPRLPERDSEHPAELHLDDDRRRVTAPFPRAQAPPRHSEPPRQKGPRP